MIEDPSLIALFLSDLAKHNAEIRKDLSLLSLKLQAPAESLQSLIASFRLIKGNALLIQCSQIAEACRDVELCLSKFSENQHSSLDESCKVLSDLERLLSQIEGQGLSTFSSFIQENQDKLRSIIMELQHAAENLSASSNPSSKNIQKPSAEKVPKPAPKISKTEVKEALIDDAMVDMFRIELETQAQILNEGLIGIESLKDTKEGLEPLMRAAHSIKGAGRVMGLEIVVKLAHIMEDCMVAGQIKKIQFSEALLDALFQGIDVFTKLAKIPGAALNAWVKDQTAEILKIISKIVKVLEESVLENGDHPSLTRIKKIESDSVKSEKQAPEPNIQITVGPKKEEVSTVQQPRVEMAIEAQDKILRVTAENLNKLMGLAGETLVESRWLQPFGDSLMKMKKNYQEMNDLLYLVRDHLHKALLDDRAEGYLSGLQRKIEEGRQSLVDRLTELDLYIVRNSSLSDRLYNEVIASRMRPFKDGVEGFPRMVHDLSRALNKKARLEIRGKNTSVDRDILEKLEAPLGHLLRNAIDHGIETPDERSALGKPVEGTILLEADHKAGMLSIVVSDDGRGIDLNRIREKIQEMGLVKKELGISLTEAELLDFLFLPGFSTAKEVTEISGRGVGLDVVQSMIQQVSGSIRVDQSFGKGTSFYLQLPLTLSVIRALIVEIAKEPYAFPLARIERSISLNRQEVLFIEGRQYFRFEGQNIGLVSASQVLELEEAKHDSESLFVIVVAERSNYYGVVVDKFLGEKELVVQELEKTLGKVQNISAGALMENGDPLLIIDVEDFVRSIDNILYGGALNKLEYGSETSASHVKKRILVVDDSITVREVECRLLRNKGYEVEAAVNGADGWNAVRIGNYDLVVTDIDMPRMNGIELIRAIRQDIRLKEMPTMIVSYKEREEDRLKGMEAGANYYLTKSSFHDETLLEVVEDLIGPP